MATQLTDLTVDEVSLVDRAANRRRFLLMKSAGHTGDDMAIDEVKILKTVETIDKAGFGPALEALAADKDPTETEELLKSVPEADRPKARAAIRVLGGALAKSLMTPKTVEKIVEKTVVPGVIKKADGSYDLSGVKDETARAALEITLKKADEADARATKVEKERRREHVTKAITTDFKHLPGVTADDFAPIIEKVQDALEPKEYTRLTTALKAASEAIRKGAMFTELGRDASGVAAGTAAAEIQAKAEELRKADPKMTIEQARARVIKSDRPLYDRSVAESNGKRAISE